MWRWRERVASHFFFSQRKVGKSVKHKRRPVPRSSSSGSRPGNVKMFLGTQGEAGGDRNISEHLPDHEKGPTSGVDGGEFQEGCGEVCQPALASIWTSADRPLTPGRAGSTEGLQMPRESSGVGCTDTNMVNGFQRIAVHQEPWRDPVCPQEACTPQGAELVTEGKTSTRTLSPGCQTLPGLGLSSDRRPQPRVPHKALSLTIKGT